MENNIQNNIIMAIYLSYILKHTKRLDTKNIRNVLNYHRNLWRTRKGFKEICLKK